MSSDNSNSNNNNNNSSKPPSPPPADMQRHRRGSLTASNPFSQLFTRSNSVATAAGTPVFPSAITSAAIQEQQRRRLSLSTAATLGITGTSPTSASSLARRASMSTNSDWDENAIEEEDAPPFTARTAPVSPFNRRVSFGTAAAMRRPGGSSPGSGNDQGFNWSEQLRSRAESSVATGSRPSFSFASGLTGSPPRPGMTSPGSTHDRARSVSEMPAPPAQTPKPRSPRGDPRPKPDHFQERILKGDFYMD
ncbi:hypothetical protein M406DRAFT_357530 [Cryphonectria parasitica EP155]|uniref:Uncharacterized protein n=1 Tax=Cryphonectria parasitica (strain ATCC 38755 / EP155) TaxID=660469 RepID=A0A9P5CM12_CRYP1|nr:uncharacterized protein M406DRAFT_357530 [Cryphonectria parasitica EP155]KAF3762606.1 hypothetical protein M406DRAFT_357530 [Cryphonectria parasitica EP155]